MLDRMSTVIAGTRHPTARVALQARLVGDADGLVADVQAVTAALHRPVLEGHPGLLDQPGAEQDAVAGHAHDVALQPAEVGQEDVDGLPLTTQPGRHNGRNFGVFARS